MTQKFLITGYYLEGYHGSMVHILEMSQVLSQKGFEVYIAGVEITPDIADCINSKTGAKVYFFDNLPLEHDYDYVVVLHDIMLPYLINKGLKYKKIATMSLSSFCPIEVPGVQCLQGIPLLVHSKEVYDKYDKELGIKSNIFFNSVLNSFDIEPDGLLLKNIAIISNHVPQEVLDASIMLQNEGYFVDIYGKGHIEKLITPEILKKYGLVITIGKTVQFALYMGIPVYNYDCFGGDGYITINNVFEAEEFNFSGRNNTRKLSGKEIFTEIVTMYSNCLESIPELKSIARDRYSWDKNIQNLLTIMDNSNSIIKNTPEWLMYSAKCIAYCEHIIGYKYMLLELKKIAHQPIKFYKLINKITLGKCYRNKLIIYKNLEKYQSMLF